MIPIDLTRQWSQLYNPPANSVVFVDVPRFHYLMLDGEVDPNDAPEFLYAMDTLFSLSITLKFLIRRSSRRIDYHVTPIEALWEEGQFGPLRAEPRTPWRWTVMMAQPGFVLAEDVMDAIEELRRKKKYEGVDRIRFADYSEGRSAQLLTAGACGQRNPEIVRLHRAIAESGWLASGRHHEIYLNDPRRTAPARLRIILRQPVCAAASAQLPAAHAVV